MTVGWRYNFWMETCLIGSVINNSFATVSIFQGVRSFRNNNIHSINLSQFAVFRKCFTIGKLLSSHKVKMIRKFNSVFRREITVTHSKLYSKFSS